MTSQPKDEFQYVEKEVLAKLNADDVVDYLKLEADPEVLQKAEKAMKKTYDELKTMMGNTDSLESALAHLSPERQELIKTTFRLQSFKADLRRQADGTVELLFESLKGTPLSFLPSVVKVDKSNWEENDVILAARIILEIVVMLLNLVGIVATPSEQATAQAMSYISKILNSQSSVLGDVKKLVEAAQKQNFYEMAKLLVARLIDLFAVVGTPVINIVKFLLEDYTWTDMIITVSQCLCFLTTVFFSGGAAVVAKVVSWLLGATAFMRKLKLFKEYENIKNSL